MKPYILLLSFLCCFHLSSARAEVSSSQVPSDVVRALAAGDALLALQAFPSQSSDAKTQYLLHELLHVTQDEVHKGKKSNNGEVALYRQIRRRGIAYHNLYLFLRTQDVNEKNFLKKARSYYTHAAHLGSELNRAKCQVLLATLFALDGDEKRANKQFSLVSPQLLGADAEMVSYVANFWGAREDVEQTLLALQYAHSLAPKQVATWVNEGDDFFLIRGDERFQLLLNDWQQDMNNRQRILTIPHNNTLVFDLPELGSQYRFSANYRAQKKSKIYKQRYPSF